MVGHRGLLRPMMAALHPAVNDRSWFGLQRPFNFFTLINLD
jgi:hypothetical protein